MLHNLLNEIRIGFRMLSKQPVFSFTAILVLAIGIGANTAMFSLVNSLLFRPSGIEQPDQLRGLFSKNMEQTDSYRAFSFPNFADIRAQNDVFESLMAHEPAMVGLGEGDETRRVFASLVSSNYFKTLGVRLIMGREFDSSEEQPGAGSHVAVIGFRHWQRLGADPEILGKTIRVNGENYLVVGVAPESYRGPIPLLAMDVYLPFGVWESVDNNFSGTNRRSFADRNNPTLNLVGRLREGVTEQKAAVQLEGLAARLREDYPDANRDQTLIIAPRSRFSISTSPRNGDGPFAAVSLFLMAMSGIVLLIACLNLGHMQASRSAAREQEFAIRMALGGSGSKIVRQLLVEALILSFLGGFVGFVFSIWAPAALTQSLSQVFNFDVALETSPDWRVVSATVLFCMLSALFFALRPALKLSRNPLFESLKSQRGSGSQWGTSKGFFRGRNLPVISEVALSLALLIVAGLFVRGAWEATGVDPGFETQGAAVLETDVSYLGYSDEQTHQLYEEVLERFRSHPAVEAASLTSLIPFGMVEVGRVVQRQDVPFSKETGIDPTARFTIVGAEYFEALGTRLLDGRGFSRREEQTGQPVAVIDELLARKLWPAERAVGQRLKFSDNVDDPLGDLEIVGVVASMQNDIFESERKPQVFVPMGLTLVSSVHFMARAGSEEAARSLLPELRALALEADPRFPVLNLRTLHSHLSESVSFWLVNIAAKVFSAFGVIALLLAVVGVYGVRAYSVVRRTREIGVRMALGASEKDAVWMVLREGLWMTAIGSGLGLLLSLALGQIVGSYLYGVTGTDALVFALGTGVLSLVMLLACYLPARRAARIDPLEALRCD